MNRWYTAQEYARYLFKARHRQGFGIHSPFVFHLLNEVIFNKGQFYCYESIESIREQCRNNQESLTMNDAGQGHYATRTISSIVKQSVKSKKEAQLLFRLVNMNRSSTILELGTALGITSLYLASANSNAKVVTIEADKQLCDFAQRLFDEKQQKNIRLICGNIDHTLPRYLEETDQLDFVFFDANHSYEATMHYAAMCLTKIYSNTIFAVDDIHWSPTMTQAWTELKNDSRVRLSIDLFSMGLLFFNRDLQKQDYVVAF
ncbi:MAG: O-methyltransferase [Microbacter sp.]